MEDKWIVILISMFLFLMFAPIGCMEHQKNQCRLEAIKATMPADDIIKVCGK